MLTTQGRAKSAVGCETLDEFFDGEAREDVATAFRLHLVDCERCVRMLHGRMLEELVANDSPGS
jgi:hypothetical protein